MTRITSYNLWQQLSATAMALMLLWLTVSLPFVQAANSFGTVAMEQGSAADDFFGDNNEEKSESGLNGFSEFLHEIGGILHASVIVSRSYQTLSVRAYLPHHPEYFSPPPEVMG